MKLAFEFHLHIFPALSVCPSLLLLSWVFLLGIFLLALSLLHCLLQLSANGGMSRLSSLGRAVLQFFFCLFSFLQCATLLGDLQQLLTLPVNFCYFQNSRVVCGFIKVQRLEEETLYQEC